MNLSGKSKKIERERERATKWTGQELGVSSLGQYLFFVFRYFLLFVIRRDGIRPPSICLRIYKTAKDIHKKIGNSNSTRNRMHTIRL